MRRRIERAFCELVVYLLRGDLLPENLSHRIIVSIAGFRGDDDATHTYFASTIFLAAFTLGAASSAQAQNNAEMGSLRRLQLGARQDIVVSGTPFNMNGGSASVAYNLTSWFGLVGDFGIYEQGQVAGKPFNLTVTAYEFGPRVSYSQERARRSVSPRYYSWRRTHRRHTLFQPAESRSGAARQQQRI